MKSYEKNLQKLKDILDGKTKCKNKEKLEKIIDDILIYQYYYHLKTTLLGERLTEISSVITAAPDVEYWFATKKKEIAKTYNNYDKLAQINLPNNLKEIDAHGLWQLTRFDAKTLPEILRKKFKDHPTWEGTSWPTGEKWVSVRNPNYNAKEAKAKGRKFFELLPVTENKKEN